MDMMWVSKMRRCRLTGADRGAVAVEYAVIGAIVGLGLVSALVGTKGSLNADYSRISASMYQGQVEKPPYASSTPVGAPFASTMNGLPSTRQNYVNNDGSTRYVETVNDPTKVAQYGVISQDVTFASNGNMLYRVVQTQSGDFPGNGNGQLVDSNFVYTGPNTYTFHEQSGNLAAYAWTDVQTTITNGQTTSQVVLNKDGSRYRSDFTYDANGNMTAWNVTQLPRY
jgi:YD repeat-containing protein